MPFKEQVTTASPINQGGQMGLSVSPSTRILEPYETVDAPPGAHDWEVIARSAAFRELVAQRRRYSSAILAVFALYLGGYIILLGYGRGFLGESVYESATVAIVLGLSQFALTWLLTFLYIRRAQRVFDPLAAEAADVQAHTSASGMDGVS